MPVVAPPVDENGDISFNLDEGLIIPLREVDASGEEIDISGLTRYFTIGHGKLRVEVGLDPNNAKGKRLVLTTEQLSAVQGLSGFSYTDEDNVVPIALWEGKIYERNLA